MGQILGKPRLRRDQKICKTCVVCSEADDFSGIWESWKHPETGVAHRTFCVITCAANEVMATIHDRMPVILPPENSDRWLSTIEPHPRDFLVPFPSELMKKWPISSRVNVPRNDDPTPLDEVPEQKDLR